MAMNGVKSVRLLRRICGPRRQEITGGWRKLFQVEDFWVVTPCSVVVGDQRLGGPDCLHIQGEVLRNGGGLPQHYTASQPRRPRLEPSSCENLKSCSCCQSRHKAQPGNSSFTVSYAMEAYWGSGGIAPRILGLGTRWRWVVSLTPRPLYPPGKEHLLPVG
jgi:hypothetical protein